MDVVKVCGLIIKFINYKIRETKKSGVVLGISGGIDSAVAAALATVAIGRENVHGLLMPFYHSKHFKDALSVVHGLGIPYSTIWINGIYDAFYDTGHLWKNRTKENTMARIRMVLLYAFSSEWNFLVSGTSNLTELQTGYVTKHGDVACDIEPLGQVVKKYVYELGRHFNKTHEKFLIPESVFIKEPTAELDPDKLDIYDLGPYEIADRIVEYHVFRKGDMSDIKKCDISRIMNLVKLTEHKRSMPSTPRLPYGPDTVTMSESYFLKILRDEIDDPSIDDKRFRELVRDTLKKVVK